MFSAISLSVYYQILAFFSLGLGIYLSILLLSANPKAMVSRVFILFTFFSLIWATGPYLINLIGISQFSLFYIKLCYAMAALNGYSGYLLVICLFPKIQRANFLDIMCPVLGLFGFLFAMSPFFIKGVESTVWGISPILGTGKFFYFLVPIFFTLLVPYLLIRGYRSAPSVKKSQYFYFLVGLLMFIITSGIFAAFLPLLGYPVAKYWPIGCLGPIFLVSFTAIAVFKNQAFEVKAILTDFLVGIFGIILLLIPLLATGLIRVLGLFLFILFCIIGYSLIRHTHQEVKQKEILEQKVQDRTKELQKRVDELNRWYKATIGRELTMVELKKRIKELEKAAEKE